jgi:AcrR family transcriptional regulator
VEPGSDAVAPRRSGAETRGAIQQVALQLFTTQGYEATAMRQIAEALGIRKASLYYHFAGKEEIVRSLLDQRGDEAEQLLAWVADQPQDEGLPKRAVLRWVASFSTGKLYGIRFLAANPLLIRSLDPSSDDRIGTALSSLVDALTPTLVDPTPERVLRLRVALLSINAAVAASQHGGFTDEQVLSTARSTASVLMDSLARDQDDPGSRPIEDRRAS